MQLTRPTDPALYLIAVKHFSKYKKSKRANIKIIYSWQPRCLTMLQTER